MVVDFNSLFLVWFISKVILNSINNQPTTNVSPVVFPLYFSIFFLLAPDYLLLLFRAWMKMKSKQYVDTTRQSISASQNMRGVQTNSKVFKFTKFRKERNEIETTTANMVFHSSKTLFIFNFCLYLYYTVFVKFVLETRD